MIELDFADCDDSNAQAHQVEPELCPAYEQFLEALRSLALTFAPLPCGSVCHAR